MSDHSTEKLTDSAEIVGVREAVSLDGVVFEMLSSTTSAVSSTPTRFTYHEDRDVVWGEYSGDTVIVGRFSGLRSGDTVRLSYHHRQHGSGVTAGQAESVISRQPDGLLRLTEFYTSADGSPQVSVCTQVV
ncbi:hypothetical protein [Lysinibacter sp. HNR]|uniref:hypothetical protein n=1 Tax=Lysinibacter sp. HNR TaxID=3031408 RepID=UPI0024355BDB|nr:hypothetical protein [Lysinibacter sp. HNR]WGD37126.1 hypothetical protein FrondiHNR_11920 [Lysinibacter sp. HNR]